MKGLPAIEQAKQAIWFKHWFDSSYYHKLYAHRDQKEADAFIDALIRYLNPAPESSMLDVGCGRGRHCRMLAEKGFKATGIDLAYSSILEALNVKDENMNFFQHDMRLPFRRNGFDYVFNFFTSFGYFETEKEHLEVIENMASAVRSSGRVVIDYLNVSYAESQSIPFQEKEIDGVYYQLIKWSDKRHFSKKIWIQDDAMPSPMEFVEKVAKFGLSDFLQMLSLNGLEIDTIFGDYHLNGYNPMKSPRLIIIAKKANM